MAQLLLPPALSACSATIPGTPRRTAHHGWTHRVCPACSTALHEACTGPTAAASKTVTSLGAISEDSVSRFSAWGASDFTFAVSTSVSPETTSLTFPRSQPVAMMSERSGTQTQAYCRDFTLMRPQQCYVHMPRHLYHVVQPHMPLGTTGHFSPPSHQALLEGWKLPFCACCT